MQTKVEFNFDAAETIPYLDHFISSPEWPPHCQRVMLAKRLIALGWILLDADDDPQE